MRGAGLGAAGLAQRELDVDRRRDVRLVLDLGLGQRGAVLRAPVHRLLALVDHVLGDELAQRPDDRRLVGEGHRQVRVVPQADDAEPLEVAALDLDVLLGVGAAGAAEVGGRHRALLRAQLAVDLELDRQAVAVPPGQVGGVEAEHVVRLDDEVLEDLVERGADVDLAVGVGRAVVQQVAAARPCGRRGSGRTGPSPPTGPPSRARSSAGWPSWRRPSAADCTCLSTQPWGFPHCTPAVCGVWPSRRRPHYSGEMVQRVHARQRPDRPRPGGAHRAAGLGVVLVQGRLARRGAGRHRRLALGRAHELQGHDQHPARPGQGHHRAVRRQLERLHLARSDDLPRDRHHRRPRPDAVHRGRTDGQLPLRPGRLRVGADGDHLGAAGRRRTTPSSGSTPRSRPPRSRPIPTGIRPSAGSTTCGR